MTNEHGYDGTGKLNGAVAKLYGLSIKSQAQIAELNKQAKAALGITSKAKVLPDDERLAIYHWHYERLNADTSNPVELYSQPAPEETVEIISQTDGQAQPESTGAASRHEAVELFAQGVQWECVEIISQPESVDRVSQDRHGEPVDIISQHGINDLVRVAFYTAGNGVKKRQVIALDGFYINALMLAAGIGKTDVPKWVQGAVDNWQAFDPLLPVTKQVKCLIVRELAERYAHEKSTAPHLTPPHKAM